MGAFGLQLLFNFAWSGLFFALHHINGALVDILLLDLAVFYTMLLFFRRDRLAGLLFLAYLGWVAYATLLNHAFGQMNTYGAGVSAKGLASSAALPIYPHV